ncbi:winged helix-turn-helix transcriptional regulator [Aquiluna borgnonia]|jgi:DNA-binding response OmpR family regulator|uniref:Winged helix-turn-helix transcriptional regulator n=1 Tax=Aquiluna borgnonia TaxID=2499157 RepID=A0A7D4UJN5_9MICO|nr:winged helix-turn-helix domain-containing protein [Aquiluna borgnonia]QKJ24739.1 winged helix-turn-helix transcriptional regulator [Aquiluna borgnonia]
MTNLTTTKLEAKGFALYVGISEQDAEAAGLSLAEIATELRATIARLLPEKASETYATLALAPEGVTGRNLDITRVALKEPKATATKETKAAEQEAAKGLVVDLVRRRLFVDGRNAQLTCKEFELFAFLIENTGRTVTRQEIAAISERCGEPTPNARTIDVHVRRLRGKIEGYEDVIRTARGQGYRFDKHPDVLIEEL